MRRASSVWVSFSSERYCLRRSTPPNIGDSYSPSTGLTYTGLQHTYLVGKTPPKRTVWARIKEALKDAGRPDIQKEAARIAGIEQPSVAEWNRPDVYPAMPTVVKLADELNVCVEWIYTERGPKTPGPPADQVAQRLWEVWPRLNDEQRRDLLGIARNMRFPASSPDTPEAVPQRPKPSRGAGSSRTGS